MSGVVIYDVRSAIGPKTARKRKKSLLGKCESPAVIAATREVGAGLK